MITATYHHHLEESEMGTRYENLKHNMHLHHGHLSPAETTALVVTLLQSNNADRFSVASKIIDRIQECGSCIAASEGRGRPYDDKAFLKRLAKNDSKLHMHLLKLYTEALELTFRESKERGIVKEDC